MSTVRRYLIGDLDLTDYPFATFFDGDAGAPLNVAGVIDSMLQDGELVSSDRSSNRTMAYSVLIEEADLEAMARAEAALMLETEKRQNTWTIDPGDDLAAPTVFDIFRVQVTFVADDEAEWQGYRRYDLTFPALPYGRAEFETVVDALTSGASPSSTTIANGSSASNWTGTSTVTSVSGWLQQSVPVFGVGANSDGAYYSSVAEFIHTPGSPLDFSTEPYLSFDLDPPGAGYQGNPVVTVFADGVQVAKVAGAYTSTSVLHYSFVVPDPSVAVLKIRVEAQTFTYSPSAPGSAIHRIDNVTKSNQAPNASTTGRETLRTVPIKGSARTAAMIAVEHESTALGTTLVYTAPALSDAALGYQPSCQRWRSSVIGTPTSDTSTLSGSRSLLAYSGSGSTVFNIPAASLPKGTYALVGRLRVAGSANEGGVVSATVGTRSGSTLFGAQTVTSAPLTLLGGAGTSPAIFTMVTLGMVTLPVADVPAASTATVEIGPFDWSGADDVVYDDLFLFWLGDDAALSWVDAGTFTRWWLDPASPSSLLPSSWVGTQSDRSDAVSAGGLATSWGVHSFVPPSMFAFVVSTTAQNPSVRFKYFRRFHTHATQDDDS